MTARFISINLTEPDYLTIASYERSFDADDWRKTFVNYWIISVYLSVAYIILVLGGVNFMKTRKPFKINRILIVWNIGLSVMSIWAFSRCLPEFIHTLTSENGFYYSVCEWKVHSHATAFWGFVLVLSKAAELGDTAFIVLRKSNLMFLHYYHHVATLMSWWYMYYYYEPVTLWYIVMNSFVHSMMYPYYTLRALKVKVPTAIAIFITSFQLIQMFVGISVNIYSFWVMYVNGTPADCPHRTWIGLALASTIYLSFAFLFARFFIKSYVVKGKVKSKKV